jgi:succinyl-diaminopimelate desuccinylase
MEERDMRPDLCLVGEPTSVSRIGDTVKIGRRGSVNMWIDVRGAQGHVAYPHLADNPITRLVKALNAIAAIELDAGSQWFQPSNIEITDIAVGNPAHNVIPATVGARLNIRFNDLHSGTELGERIRNTVLAHAPDARLKVKISGESFLTEPGALSDLVTTAIREETGLEAELSTSGGTSDARFLRTLCPVIEFGLPNATMHKLDEAVAIADLHVLQRIYARVIRSALGAG